MEPASDTNFDAKLAERFAQLPTVVQNAITSADVQKHLRELADTHKLHIDQWQVLENNVMLTLLGFQPIAELTMHLKKDLSVTDEVAAELAGSISKVVFEPIRGEMEKQLDHPSLVEQATAMETVRTEALEKAASEVQMSASAPAPTPPAPHTTASPAPAITPATPPAPAPTEKAIRGSIAESYVAAPSHERKSIEGDPYREQIA